MVLNLNNHSTHKENAVKKIISLTSLFLACVFLTPLYAVDQISLEPGAGIPSSDSMLQAFSLIVTGDGQLTVKPGAVFTEGEGDRGMMLPYLVSHPKSILYPRWAVRQGWQGKLVLALEILTSGNVGRYQVMQSTGHRMLDEEALTAVKTWKFHPAMQNSKPVLTCIQIPISFELEKE